MILAETYWELMTDSAHWMMELTMLLIFDVVIGMIAWPLFKKWLQNHDERKHAHIHCGVHED